MDTEQLKKYYQQYRLIIFPVVTAGASLILIALVIFPQLSKFLSNNEAYTSLQKQNEFLEVKADELENVNSGDLKQKLDISLAALPAGRDLTETMALLQSIVAQSGFLLNSLEFGSSAAGKGTTGYTVNLDVTGSKANLSNLLNSIESSYRPMKVNNVDVALSRTDDNVNSTISINVFYAPIPNSVGKIDAPVPKLSATEQELIDKLSQETSLASSVDQSAPVNISPTGKADPFE